MVHFLAQHLQSLIRVHSLAQIQILALARFLAQAQILAQTRALARASDRCLVEQLERGGLRIQESKAEISQFFRSF